MLSIIIPTLNEEKYLPQLLDSIKKQSFRDYEIIVADAGSKDRTREIAKSYGCKVVEGGLPAKGRNQGAAAASGDLLLFIDADVILPEGFLRKSISELQKRNIGVGSFAFAPINANVFYKVIFWFYNLFLRVTSDLLPFGGVVILATMVLHKRLKGFDEGITFGEDTDYLRRAKRIGEYGLLRSTFIGFSLRRFRTQGAFRTILQYILCGLHLIFIGPVRSDIFKYRFNIYGKEKNNRQ